VGPAPVLGSASDFASSGLSVSFDVDPDPDGKGNFGIFDCCLKFSGKENSESKVLSSEMDPAEIRSSLKR
jgi:hypothetical protein